MKIRIEIGDKILFSHDDPLSYKINEETSASYDLEKYEVPAVVRKVLKKQKKFEIIQIRCKM